MIALIFFFKNKIYIELGNIAHLHICFYLTNKAVAVQMGWKSSHTINQSNYYTPALE